MQQTQEGRQCSPNYTQVAGLNSDGRSTGGKACYKGNNEGLVVCGICYPFDTTVCCYDRSGQTTNLKRELFWLTISEGSIHSPRLY